MLWSIIKVSLFVAIALGLTYGAAIVLETPGGVNLSFAGREWNFTPLAFGIGILVLMAALWILFRLVGLLVALLRFLSGDETAITRYFNRNRERKGYEAFSDGLMALAAGDTRLATAKAAKAEKLLHKPELTRLLNAQVAHANGDTAKAIGYYKQMLTDDRSRFVGVQGLMAQKLAEGDRDTALKLAEKAFAIRPKHVGTLDTLFELQSEKADWSGARRTLEAKVKAKALPRDVGRRRDAVLSLADARAAITDDEMPRAREAAYQAVLLAPGLVPAAVLAAEMRIKAGEKRVAAKILRKAWEQSPHPDLAAAFAAIEPDETPEQRLKRFGPLIKTGTDQPESRLLLAELELAAENFPAARRALGDLAENDPTTRSLAIMAAIERGEGAPDKVIRGWLAKALGAPKGESWCCASCKHIHGAWMPVCENCSSFDALEWKRPPQTEDAGTAGAAMLPLIVGALEDEAEEPVEPEEPSEILDDDTEQVFEAEEAKVG